MWQLKHLEHQKNDAYYKLHISDQVAIFTLRKGLTQSAFCAQDIAGWEIQLVQKAKDMR